MRHGKGTDLPGMTDPEGATVGVIYVSPEDDRKTVLTAILAEERLKREQIVLVLPLQNKAFQRPHDFDDLKMLRRKIQAELIFVTPAGPGPAEFARQRRFAVFSTEESFVRSFTTGSPNPPAWSTSTPSKTPAKKGLFGFGGAKKAAPIAAAGAAGFVAGEAIGKAQTSETSGTSGGVGKNMPQRRSRGLTPASDVTNLPTQPVAQRSSKPLRPAEPLTPIPATEDEHEALRPAGIEAADTVDQHKNTGLRDAGVAGAAGLGAGLLAADFAHHAPSAGPNIDNDDDWDDLPPAPGQSIPSRLPNTPAATGAGIVGVRTASTSGSPAHTPIPAIDPNPIELPMSRGTAKVTKKLPPSAVPGMATQAVPTSATTATPPRRSTGKMAAAGAAGAVAGAMTAEALSSGASNTGRAAAGGATRTPVAAGGTRPPMRNLSSIGPGGPGMGGPMNPRRVPPRRNRWRIAIVALIILIILLFGGWEVTAHPDVMSSVGNTLTGNSNTPATIAITPASKTVQDTYLMQGVTTGPANPDNRQVTVRTLNSTKTTTKSATATGHTQTAAALATGRITFLNGSANTFSVAAGTIFQVGNIQIATSALAIVPPRTVGPPAQFGQQTVNAHAVQGGTAGNIAALAINQFCCDQVGDITAQNQNAFSGGVDAQNYTFLQASDVNAVTTANQDALKTDAQNDIKGQMKSGEQLLGNINCDDPKTTEDVLPGAHGVNVTSANVTVNVSCSAEVFDANAVQTIAQKALQQKASKDPGPGYVLAGAIITQAQQPVIQQDSITFPVVAQGVWYYPWTTAMKQALLNKIKGKSIAQAQAILNKYPGVGTAKITINNGGNTLPGDINQITLDIKTITGLTGGNQQPGTGGNSTVPPQSSITPISGNGVIPAQPVGLVKG